MILQLRIDERLAHGQVCTTWINTLGASHVIIANDPVASDDLQKTIMKMGMPSTVKSMFATLDKAIDLLNNPKSKPLKMFVVTQTPKDALYLVERINGIDQVEVNLANYGQLIRSNKEIKENLSGMVLLDEDNIALVKQIQGKVKSVYFQDIVGRPKHNIKF